MRGEQKRWTCGPPGSLSSALAGGFVAGVAAGVVLVVTRLVLGFGAVALLARLLPWRGDTERIVHREFWASVKSAAHPFVGDRVYRHGFDAPVVLLAVVVVVVFSIGMGLLFGLIARGRSRMMACAIAIPFGFAAWICDMLLLDASLATVVEAIPSGLALAFTFLWYERRLSSRPLLRR